MSKPEVLFEKGSKLTERIWALCSAPAEKAPARLVLSFDQFCVLLEYSSLVGTMRSLSEYSVEELLVSDDLIFESGDYKLDVAVDFFAEAGTIRVV